MNAMKRYSLWLMAGMYFVAGILHFIIPAKYETLIPAWLPAHYYMIYASGVAEIILAVVLMIAETKKIACLLIIAMLAIFLVLIHIPHTLALYGSSGNGFILNLIRTPLQLLLMAWAWMFVKAPVKIK